MTEPAQEVPRLHSIQPGSTSKAVQAATNEDVTRASRTIGDSLQAIIKGLEREMYEAQVVRNTITKRIVDLHTAINAARSSLEALNNYSA